MLASLDALDVFLIATVPPEGDIGVPVDMGLTVFGGSLGNLDAAGLRLVSFAHGMNIAH